MIRSEHEDDGDSDDVATAVDHLRRERPISISEAVNELVRAGLIVKQGGARFRQRTARLRLAVDVTNIAEAMELLDGRRAVVNEGGRGGL